VAVHPAARRRPKPGSGPRCHDGCGYFIASVTHRRTLPVPQPRCAMASERWCYAARPAELTSSKTEPSIHHLLSRAAHHSPAPPRRQIAIDAHRPCRPPRVPSLEAFGRRPSARVHRSRRSRHPKPFTKPAVDAGRANGRRSRSDPFTQGSELSYRGHLRSRNPLSHSFQTPSRARKLAASVCQALQGRRRAAKGVRIP
jgi:hypothetical protein